MAVKSNFLGRNVPSLSTRKSAPVTTNFAKGIYTYKPNDTMTDSEIRLAQDARFDRVGEYGTRLGYKKLYEPFGRTWLNTPSGDAYTRGDLITPYSYTLENDATIYAVRIRLYRAEGTDDYVILKIALAVNGEPVTSSYIDSRNFTTTETTFEAIFAETVNVVTGDVVTFTLTPQVGSLENLYIRTQDDPDTTPLYSAILSATPGNITNIFEANIDGVKSVLFAFKDSAGNMSINFGRAAGDTVTIRNLPAGVEKVRFCQNLNTVRYTDGKEVPHLLTPTVNNGVVTAWADSAIDVKDLQTGTTINVTMRNIMNGTADNLIYFATTPDTEALWTYPYGYSFAKSPAFSTTATISGNPGTTLSINKSTITPSGIAVGDWITGQGNATAEVTSISGNTVNLRIVDTTPQTISSYDKFSTDFYQNFPAIKTGDPLTAMFNLGGVMYFMTKRNKYQMYSQSAEAWTQSNTNAQNGTFSQESVVCDLNYAYFANDNGIYIFDGASESSLTENSIQNVYDAIPDKENIVLDLYKNRLYVYYTSVAGGDNDHCLVYNINLKVWESFDSNTWVSATSARQNASSRFICGHSRIGLLMLNESIENNNYSDMGQPIAFNLETSYQHFGSTSQLKRISKWRPQFATTERPYTVECGYSLDYSDQVKYAFSIDLYRQVPTQTNYVWDNPSDYGVPAIPTRHTTIPKVNGEFYRCQIRYQHIAAFEPVIFRSHTLTVETQRIR